MIDRTHFILRRLWSSGSSCWLLACVLVVAACHPARPAATPVRAQRVLYGWYDDGGPGKVSITISLPEQIAEFHRGGRPVGWCYVATGLEGHGTRPGNYRITEKIVDKYSNRYGWIEDEFGNTIDNDARYDDPVPEGMRYVPAPMPYWMRLTSYGIGMHGGVIPQPGQPASHGCIRLPTEIVPVVYDSVEVGTRVAITREPPTQGPWMRGAPRALMAETVSRADGSRLSHAPAW